MYDSYYAAASGMLKISATREETKERVAALIRSSIAEYICAETEDDESTLMTFVGSSYPYREETLGALLEAANGCCQECRIEFSGEDRELWCMHYDSESGGWVRLRGRIIYEKE